MAEPKIIAYAMSIRLNALLSTAQYNSALPKNRTGYDIPLVALSDYAALVEENRVLAAEADRLRAIANDLQAHYIAMQNALKFYANPEIYKPHPHGPAFDRRDLSFSARSALAKGDGE